MEFSVNGIFESYASMELCTVWGGDYEQLETYFMSELCVNCFWMEKILLCV